MKYAIIRRGIFTVLGAAVFGGALLAAGCSDWTESRPEFIDKPGHTARYYASLRDYKNSDHARYFGWYAGWVGTGARMSNSLRGLPDSLDIVSLWENQTNLDRNRMEDMRYVQQVKGTKVLFTFIVRNCGDGCTPAEHAGSVEEKSAFWGFVENDDAAREAACRKYANAVCDSLFKYGYDGFDIDFEPSYGYSGNIAMKASVDPKPMLWFVGELSKRIGPLSGSGKMLVIDGETWSSPAELAPVYDYIIEQAYEAREPEDLQDRFDRYIKLFSPHRDAEELARIWFVTENFEKHRGTGGVAYVEQDGTTMNSLLGMARWNPTLDGRTVRKGGCGVYRIETEYALNTRKGTFPWSREAMQAMNPSNN